MPAVEQVFEGRAVDEGGEQEEEIGGLEDAVEGDNVGMGKVFEGIGFTLEALGGGGVIGEVGVQNFHGKRDVALEVPNAVDGAHTACSDELIDAVLVLQNLPDGIRAHEPSFQV